jgi:hypothetical protein
MDENICPFQSIQTQIAGSPAGISADEDLKSLVFQRCRDLRSFSLQTFGQLDGDPFRVPAFQLGNNFRKLNQ